MINKLKIVITGFVLFIPITIVTFIGVNWQVTMMFLIASLIISVLININEFELFKVSKDGVELRRVYEDAKDKVDEISKLAINMLKMHFKHAIQLGEVYPYQAISALNFYAQQYNSFRKKDEELDKLFYKIEKNALHQITFSFFNVSKAITKYDYNLSKLSEEQINEWFSISSFLNPDDTPIEHLEFENDYYLSITELFLAVNRMESLANLNEKYIVGDNSETIELSSFLDKMKRQIEIYIKQMEIK